MGLFADGNGEDSPTIFSWSGEPDFGFGQATA